ncbi:alkyl transferase [Favolaschia claudopus]|uniref:Alkyl transferase n=1 Tax=Favolaschia claudopus TaxID=2862362 RepID=A0AAW0DJ32_9AGAR
MDVREAIPLILLLISLSPLCLSLISYHFCIALIATYYGLPRLIRASLNLFSLTAALLLQAPNLNISPSSKAQLEKFSHPLVKLLQIYTYAEMGMNGSSAEREKIVASALEWTNGSNVEEKLGLPLDAEHSGDINELQAYTMQTMAWSAIALQEKYGRRLSPRGRDAILMEYTCAGMRLGVAGSMLPSTYDEFLISFNKRLDNLDGLANSFVELVETATTTSERKNSFFRMFTYIQLMIGHSLLPERAKSRIPLNIILKSRSARIIQLILCAVLRLVYPWIVSLPLRGVICLMLVLHPELRPIFQTIHSIDILSDKPTISSSSNLPELSSSSGQATSYVQWLAHGVRNQRPPLLQILLVKTLASQLQSDSRFDVWLSYPFEIARICAKYAGMNVNDTVQRWRVELKKSSLFHLRKESKMPLHANMRISVGMIMDGNRRYARQRGQHILMGHAKGANVASSVLEWWVKHLPDTVNCATPLQPKYLTFWVFSSENFQRPQEERDGLFALLAAEFKNFAFTGLIHRLRIRVRFIGSDRHRFPPKVIEIMEMVEHMTSSYDGLYLQIAAGYGGRSEIVGALQNLNTQGKVITEENISDETCCAKIGVPPVNLIFRTSERRSSGFFMWDTTLAEFYFVDKLWPELAEIDWLKALGSFSRREIRGGK